MSIHSWRPDLKRIATLLFALLLPLLATPAFATTVFFTSGTSCSIPVDYNSAANDWYAIGAGGDGGQPVAGTNTAGGGGSGAFSHASNISLTANTSVTCQIGVHGGGTAAGND